MAASISPSSSAHDVQDVKQARPVARSHRPLAPRGVGDAPSRVEAQKPIEKGYIERGVVGLVKLIGALFVKIYEGIVWCFTCCCKKKPAAEHPPAPAAEPAAAEVERKAAAESALKRLQSNPEADEIMQQFKIYFPRDEDQDEIYFELASTIPTFLMPTGPNYSERTVRSQKIDIGEQMVEKNPHLLLPYLLSKVASVAQK